MPFQECDCPVCRRDRGEHVDEDDDDFFEEHEEDSVPNQYPNVYRMINGSYDSCALTNLYIDSMDGNPWLLAPGASERDVRAKLTEWAPGGTQETIDRAAWPCSSALPVGWSWYGQYFVTKSFSPPRGGGSRSCIVNPEPFTCPHCALEWARALSITSYRVMVFNETVEYSYLYLLPEIEGEPVLTSLVGSTKTTNGGTIGTGCSTCGFPGHNSRNCALGVKLYDKIGVEVEGRWLNLLPVYDIARSLSMDWASDGSIASSIESRTAEPREFRTEPGTIASVIKQVLAVYPDETDASCGMHVHVSFPDPTMVTQLMTPEFYAYFNRRWVEWADTNRFNKHSIFRHRLAGKNQYCRLNQTDGQNPLEQQRYQQLNFSAWHDHKTMECRLLPMFKDSRHAVSAIIHLMTIIHDWLAAAADSLVLPAWTPTTADPNFKVEVAAKEITHAINTEFSSPSDFDFGLSVAELPPVAPGDRRVAMSEARLVILRQMGIAA